MLDTTTLIDAVYKDYAGDDDVSSELVKEILAKHLEQAASEIAAIRVPLNLTTVPPVTGASQPVAAAAAAAQEVNSATGTLFKGERIRTYTGTIQFGGNWQPPPVPSETINSTCTKWAVVTTIYKPSLAIERAANMKGWCLVIVADTKTPSHYLESAGLMNRSNVVFFSVEDQQHNAEQATHVGALTRATPYQHFARKNLGYLYAIRQGANFIFDFDDDNIVKLSPHNDETVINIIPNDAMVQDVRVVVVGPHVLNPYPLMNTSLANSWPRGFPLESIQNVSMQGIIVEETSTQTVPMHKVGVIQFCADSNPDIDAIHRLVKPLPMNFDPNAKPLLVPSHHAFVPYNAQATIHTYPTLWATLLPSTVPGRVSDIWRSYFAECLFRDLDLAVVFAPPAIEQIRNAHNYLADMKAESDLYFKTSKLIEFLTAWRCLSDNIPGRMEQLWIDLYERGYIEERDVAAVQLWLSALASSGYQFPALRRKIHDKVVVMGQFNTEAPTNYVLLWVQKWRELFSNVVVRGRFNETQLFDLQSHGIQARSTVIVEDSSRRGWFAPIDNLQRTLQEYKDEKDVEGVLYIHDDALLNMKVILNGSSAFPSQEIIGNSKGKLGVMQDPSYTNPKSWDANFSSTFSFKIHQNKTFSKLNDEQFGAMEELVDSLDPKWSMYSKPECVPALVNLTIDPRSKPYREVDDESLLINGNTQSDFLYVPTKIANEWITVSKLFLDVGVYLECSAGPTVNIIRNLVAARNDKTIPLRIVDLCSTWGEKRGKFPMAQLCLKRPNVGVIHPIKMGYGVQGWVQAFDLLNQS